MTVTLVQHNKVTHILFHLEQIKVVVVSHDVAAAARLSRHLQLITPAIPITT
jgi:predicted ABC-type transport system involved in lysophospholipase L1 biosynthesis ATPase subunit